MRTSQEELRLIRLALKEDIGAGDITTRALKLKGRRGKAEVIAKGDGVISGIGPFCRVFKILSPSFRFRIFKKDAQAVRSGDRVIAITGPLDMILTGERTAMNILCHLCGVATLANQYVKAINGSRAKILDTRKTMPGMRMWEKEAVRHGGGYNHRIGLYDMYLVKENHIAAAGSMMAATEAALLHKRRTRHKLQVEVKNLSELKTALEYKPDFVLLDNFTIAMMKKAMLLKKSIGSKVVFEVSGNVSLKNVKTIAATGADRISIGRLTHSAPAFDLSFRIIQ
jgi:nicotinate-nucleotide pyrophosphorylase (carboxylating)